MQLGRIHVSTNKGISSLLNYDRKLFTSIRVLEGMIDLQFIRSFIWLINCGRYSLRSVYVEVIVEFYCYFIFKVDVVIDTPPTHPSQKYADSPKKMASNLTASPSTPKWFKRYAGISGSGHQIFCRIKFVYRLRDQGRHLKLQNKAK